VAGFSEFLEFHFEAFPVGLHVESGAVLVEVGVNLVFE